MTTEERVNILREREDHGYELLRKLEPTDPAFGTCLDNIHRCVYVRSELDIESIRVQMTGALPEDPENAEGLKGIEDYGAGDEPGEPGAATWEPGGGESVEEEPAHASAGEADRAPWEEPAKEAETPAVNDEPQLTLEDMRKKLIPVSTSHGDIVPGAMAEMGYAKLSQIPPERYHELLDKVEEALKCRQ